MLTGNLTDEKKTLKIVVLILSLLRSTTAFLVYSVGQNTKKVSILHSINYYQFFGKTAYFIKKISESQLNIPNVSINSALACHVDMID